jgi:hypothetical protein
MAENRMHETKEDACESFNEALCEATQSDKWMGAVWRVKNDKIELVRVTTHQFPNGDMLAAVGHLALRLFDMINPQMPNEPLPTVDMNQLPWMVNKGKENE